jgi:hypothetical protein
MRCAKAATTMCLRSKDSKTPLRFAHPLEIFITAAAVSFRGARLGYYSGRYANIGFEN